MICCFKENYEVVIIELCNGFQVDVDQRSSLTAGGQENLSAVGAHAALLSAAKAGSGYSAFA